MNALGVMHEEGSKHWEPNYQKVKLLLFYLDDVLTGTRILQKKHETRFSQIFPEPRIYVRKCNHNHYEFIFIFP